MTKKRQRQRDNRTLRAANDNYKQGPSRQNRKMKRTEKQLHWAQQLLEVRQVRAQVQEVDARIVAAKAAKRRKRNTHKANKKLKKKRADEEFKAEMAELMERRQAYFAAVEAAEQAPQ